VVIIFSAVNKNCLLHLYEIDVEILLYVLILAFWKLDVVAIILIE